MLPKTTTALAAMALSMIATTASAAIDLRTDGTGGYGQVALGKNDDQSSNVLDMPFAIDFYGASYDQFYVNNNGNITFDAPLGSFTPFSFGTLGRAMIAPYWGDVDTRCDACGNVYVGSFAPDQLTVTWDNVGYYNQQSDKLNTFQMTLFNAGNGDFDIEFRYDKLQWTTGSASDGIDGLGGIPAAAGYTNGDGVSYLQPGSFLSPGALNMANEGNTGTDGLWVYNIRNAAPPSDYGLSPSNPILPTAAAPDDGYAFTFDVGDTSTRYFIDPPVATGYDYTVSGGGLFTSAQFTSALTDPDGYQLYSGSTLLGTVAIGGIFTFTDPVSSFSLRGIDPANALQPGDPIAFVSGFTFSQGGTTTVTQTPFVENITSAVPEPTTWAFLTLGFGMVGGVARRRRVGGAMRTA